MKFLERLRSGLGTNVRNLLSAIVLLFVLISLIKFLNLIKLNFTWDDHTLWMAVVIFIFIIVLVSVLVVLLSKSEMNSSIEELVGNEITKISGELNDKFTPIIDQLVEQNSKLTEVNQLYDQLIGTLKSELVILQQLTELQNQEWLMDDIEVEKMEAETDVAIKVIAPDLYYEEQPNYLPIISDNVCQEHGPTYKYIIPHNQQNEIQVKDVYRKIIREIENGNKLGDATKEQILEQVKNRFQVVFCDEKKYPFAVLYGLAIYEWEHDNKNIILQYAPRKFGALNFKIPKDDIELKTDLYRTIRSYFDILFSESNSVSI